MSSFKKNYIYIYIFFNFFLYGVSPDISIFGGPVSYRPSFGNLETFPHFVQLRFNYSKTNLFSFTQFPCILEHIIHRLIDFLSFSIVSCKKKQA
jgi:hypothetical protein